MQAKDVLSILLAWLLFCFQKLQMYIISWETIIIYLDYGFIFLHTTKSIILNQQEFCFTLKLHYNAFFYPSGTLLQITGIQKLTSPSGKIDLNHIFRKRYNEWLVVAWKLG